MTTTSRLTVDPLTVEPLADLLGATDVDVQRGAPLPPLWHWAALARWRPWTSLGVDGHAEDELMPTRPDLPRRMFAGGQVVVHRPLRIGADVVVRRDVEQVRDTEGRSGPLRLVSVRHQVLDDDGLALDERQDIVYLPAAGSSDAAALQDPTSAEARGGLDTTVEPWAFIGSASMLMRFSALTRNNHRIHHDHPYVTGTEGYADLVVHGPLLAIVLAERVRRTGRAVRTLRHRGHAPLLAGHPAHVDLTGTEASARTTTATLREGDRRLAEVVVSPELEELL